MSAEEETTGPAGEDPVAPQDASGEAAEAAVEAKAAAKPAAAKKAAAKKAPAPAKADAEAQADGEKPPAKKRAAKKPAAKKAAAATEPVAASETAAADQPKAAAAKAAGKPAGKPAAKPARRGAKAGGEPTRRRVVLARARYVRTSARKARMVCGHLRGKSVQEARAILAFTPREVARDWSKLLESAVANAESNHELLEDDLIVREAYADEGPTIKRFRPRAMGRATPIRKRTSHLTITLTPRPEPGTNKRHG